MLFPTLHIVRCATLFVAIGTLAFAQTGGAVPPEAAGAAVAAGPSVSPFTGQFTYGLPVMTVPGPEGSSFTIELAYHSGASPDAGVSWVGYGWSLNPGAVVRETRGLPDDWRGDVRYWDNQKQNWTITAKPKINFELFSADSVKLTQLDGIDTTILSMVSSGPAGGSITFRYNSSTGFSTAYGWSQAIKGYGGLSFALDDDQSSFNAYVNPTELISGGDKGQNPNALQSSHFQYLNPYSLGISFSSDRDWPIPVISPATREISSFSRAVLYSDPTMFGLEIGLEGSSAIQNTSQTADVRPSYGYMYSADAIANPSHVMDYRLDHPTSYKKGDNRLSVPFSSPDNFINTGTGAGGSFRLWNRGAGQFRPNEVEINTTIDQEGFDLTLGAKLGIGKRFGKGWNWMTAGAWNADSSSYQFLSSRDQPNFFRMRGDPGGTVAYSQSDNAARAETERADGPGADPRLSPFVPVLPESHLTTMSSGLRNAAVVNIQHLINGQFVQSGNSSLQPNTYLRSGGYLRQYDSARSVDRSSANLIGEISMDRPDGSHAIYGLPVYAQQEMRMALGLERIAGDTNRIRALHRAYASVTTDNVDVAQGEHREGAYASAFLLTELLSPGFVDRTNNGPTVDDFGGYTKFNYRKVLNFPLRQYEVAQGTNWYSWRSPYSGMYYDRNGLSDPTDDMGSYSQGQREIYYAQSIETKTHIAVFVTNHTDVVIGGKAFQGSGIERQDAVPAYGSINDREAALTASQSIIDSDPMAAAPDSMEGLAGGEARNPCERLERVELYSKDSLGRPDVLLQTVFLEYDYSLRPGMPNSELAPPAYTARDGMLTLKRVWSQEQNVVAPLITPYEFGYEYKASGDYPASVVADYPDVTGFADQLSSAEQNPRYSSFDVDNWSDYQYNGIARFRKGRPWVNQIPDTASFDPAAWQMKWIRTPTRSEIHVQYEQHDYQYVQDRPAMAMVSLRESVGTSPSTDGSISNRYYLRLSDIGIDSADRSSVNELRSRIEQEFMDRGHKIYFKLLYALIGDTAKFGDPERNSEYITGYASVDTVGVDSLYNGSNSYYGLRLSLKDQQGMTVPKQVCLDLVRRTKRGKLGTTPEPVCYPDDVSQTVVNFLGSVGNYLGFDADDHCREIDYSNSYIRVPLIRAKKGGGIRVKRLLAFDPGTEGDSTLTGAEYIYQQYDEDRHRYISSGVATNEPMNGREENALIDLIAAGHAESKVISGRDRAKLEGPLGESILPGASVGYARVVSRSIHEGPTSPGFSVQEFHTAREFPFDGKYGSHGNGIEETDLDVDEVASPDLSFVPFSLIRIDLDLLWLTKGYRFFINGMHGAVKSSASYGGNYNDPDSWHLNSLQEVTYFSPGDSIPVLDSIGAPIRYDLPGKESEVTYEDRSLWDATADAAVEGDAIFFPPPLTFSGAAYLSYQENSMQTHITSKVVQFPVYVKSTLVYGDGLYHFSENVAFDPVTASPIVAATSDSYDRLKLQQSSTGHSGTYYSFAIPARQVYPALGPKSWGDRFVAASSQTDTGLYIIKDFESGQPVLRISSSNDSGIVDVVERMTPGDLIRLTQVSESQPAGFYNIQRISGSTIYLTNVSTTFAAANGITDTVDLEIVRSARTNQLNAMAGSILTYGLLRDSITTGGYVTRSEPWGFADRRRFADTLETRLAISGNSTIPPTSVAGTLKFLAGASCDALSADILVKVDANAITITSPGGTEELLRYGTGEHFEIEDDGTLVFYATSEPTSRQPVTTIVFCPESRLYVTRTMNGVVAASAQPLTDSLVYTSSDYSMSPANANSYELGMRGLWQSRRGYAYRSSIQSGGNYGLDQRNYKDAGVFSTFKLFNFHYPDANDTARWMKLDTIVRVAPNGQPLEIRSRLGITSCTRLGYNGLLPILAAENAQYQSVGFQSFEEWNDAVDDAIDGTVAHTGVQSQKLDADTSSTPVLFSIQATSQVISKGLLIRLWARYSTYADEQSTPALVSVKRKYTPNTEITFRLDTADRVAKVGEWNLYEIIVPGDTLVLDTAYNISCRAVGSVDAWVDDVRAHPADAEMACMVYDRRTLRPVASLDGDNFAAVSQYDARGRAVRAIVESDRGMRTVAEVHTNLPGVDRVPPPPPPDPETSTLRGPETHTVPRFSRIPRDEDDEAAAPSTALKSELVKLELGPDGHSLDILGKKNVPSSLKDAIEALTPRQLSSINRWKELDQMMSDKQAGLETEVSEETRKEIEHEVDELRRQRRVLLRHLGLTEQEMKALVELLGSAESQSDQPAEVEK